MVNIKVDNLAAPYIRIVTGENEQKAREIASSFEYILRHQQTTPKRSLPEKNCGQEEWTLNYDGNS